MYKLTSTKSTGLFGDSDHFLSQFPPAIKSSSPSKLSNGTFLNSLSLSLSSSNPSSLISSSILITEYEQIRQAQECLETSASYMNEIESFFQELSTQRPTPLNSNWPSNGSSLGTTLSIESLDTFDLDSFTFNTGNPDVIDPSIFNFTPADSETEDDEEQGVSGVFGIMHLNNKPTRKQQSTRNKSRTQSLFDSNSHSPSSSSSSSHPKPPKFYSRSGQVADPSRGPCHNCHTTLTCYWRKLKGQYHCNACTLFFKRNKYHRSGDSVADKPIKRRNRKSKYSSEQ